jgi:flagellar biosynthesis protein FlhA
MNKFFNKMMNHRGTLITLMIVSLPIVLIVPMHKTVLDFLLSANLALAVLVMLNCMYVRKPLDFSTFPSLLLILTLFRLVLNVASTRLILGEADAGEVIDSFASFVAGNNLIIGMIIFIILIVIQFLVITKGATRIAEVAARFTLDAMPGKQMAIDADLNSGLIDENEARKRREEVSNEAEFYGAMDGASKFVRGDAIAGIVITVINIVGGIISGMLLHNQTLEWSLSTFVKLSIGDGLVSQVPAFIVAIASGLLVTRSGSADTLGTELVEQLFKDKKPMFMAAGFLGMLAITGLPAMPLIALGGGLLLIGRGLKKGEDAEKAAVVEEQDMKAQTEAVAKPESFLGLDTMELEIGYGLIRLCDAAKGGDLVERIRMIRTQMASSLGFIVPAVRIRDNMQLEPNHYSVKIKGVQVASGDCLADCFLAMDTGFVADKIEGMVTTEPAFGLKATWIDPTHKEKAESLGYQVVDPTTVLATHLIEILRTHCHELLTRQEVTNLIETLRERAPRIVEDVLDKEKVSMGDIQRVLQLLLKERVSVRDLESILEVMGDLSPRLRDQQNVLEHEALAELVRMDLGRAICASVVDDDGALHVITLEPRLEDFLIAGVRRSKTGRSIEIAEDNRYQIMEEMITKLNELVIQGKAPVLLCDPSIRRHLRKMLERNLPSVTVLSTVEVPSDINLTSDGIVLLPDQIQNVA